MKSVLFLSIVTAAGLAGCYAGTGGYGYGAQYGVQAQVQAPTVEANVGVEAPVGQVDVEYAQPELIALNSGVQVVYNAEYPVFFHDNYYWRYDNNNWYRSSYYDRGWAYERNVPRAIHGIDRPSHYSHYRPEGYVSHRETNHYGNVHSNGGYHDTGYHGHEGYNVHQTGGNGYHQTNSNTGYHQPGNSSYHTTNTPAHTTNTGYHQSGNTSYHTSNTPTNTGGYHSTGGSGYHEVKPAQHTGNVHSGGSGYSRPSHSTSRPSHSTTSHPSGSHPHK